MHDAELASHEPTPHIDSIRRISRPVPRWYSLQTRAQHLFRGHATCATQFRLANERWGPTRLRGTASLISWVGLMILPDAPTPNLWNRHQECRGKEERRRSAKFAEPRLRLLSVG